MPQALLGPIALALFQAGGPIWLANALVGVGTLGSIFSAVGQIAISFGVGALANAIWKPRTGSRSEDIQQSLRVAASDRLVIYGQFQPSGNWAFGDSKDGVFHKVIAICEGKLVEVINLKVDDHIVTLDVDGMATSAPFVVNGTSRLRIRYRIGLPTETHYSELTSVFPEWTSACRGDGIVSLYATQFVIGSSKVMKVFPSLKDTLYRIEGKFTEVLNPITGVTAWSDNAAGVIRDFMRSENGMRIPDSLLSTPVAQDAWEAAWSRAAETVVLKAGGTEPRYRLWGGYRLSDAPGTVLEQMLFNCDAQPILTRDGGLAIRIGGAPAPTITLDSTYITAAISASAGMDVRATANRINSKFLSTAHDYQQIDADPWVNEDDIVIRGEIVDLVDFAWSPSHSQARRLMKLRYHRLTPRWVLTVNCRVKALAAFQEPFVNLNYTIGTTVISGVFEIAEFAWNIDQDGILRSVTISLQSIDGAMYDWNPLMEEGTAPPAPTITVDRSIPDLQDLAAVTRVRDIGGGTLVAYAGLTFDAPPSELYHVELQGKKTAETIWSDINVPEGATDVDGLLMDDGVEYEFHGRLVTISGTAGEWTSPSVTLTPTTNTAAPGVPTTVSATGGVGQVSLDWTTPNSSNFSRVVWRRNTVNDFGTAAALPVIYGSPNTAYTTTDTGLAPGSYYYWVSAANTSGVESSPVATGIVTVT